jgi:hypothetical protein
MKRGSAPPETLGRMDTGFLIKVFSGQGYHMHQHAWKICCAPIMRLHGLRFMNCAGFDRAVGQTAGQYGPNSDNTADLLAPEYR